MRDTDFIDEVIREICIRYLCNPYLFIRVISFLMKKIEIICPTMKLEDLKKTIYTFDIGGFLVTNITGVGFIRGPEKEKSVKYVEMPKIKVEFVMKDENVESSIKEITKVLQTGKIGDGKIFVYPADSVVRIRTGEDNAV